jgi:hypothetical protein
VPIPGVIAADLVVVQADLTLGLLEGLLDGLITNGKVLLRTARADGLDLVASAASFATIGSPS